MDNNDSNPKSQQTGGLKLMTVFIAVLALHVVVIGGFTVYHLMSGGSSDNTDLANIDKNHKEAKPNDSTTVAEASTPDAAQVDKTAAGAPTEVATIPAGPTPPPTAIVPDASASTAPSPAPALTPVAKAPSSSVSSMSPPSTPTTPEPTPAPPLVPTPTLTLTTPRQSQLAPPVDTAHESSRVPSGPIASTLTPPADAPPHLSTAPISTGPVHMPPATAKTAATKPERTHEQIYTVKITDSYKKIAHAHHITVAQLKETNHIKGDVLHAGQKLFIPTEKKLAAETATTSSLDAAPTSLKLAPMNTSLSTTTTTTNPTNTGVHHHLYTIVKGDTLSKIARKFKTTTAAIIAENGNIDPAKLTIGHKLKISSRESRSAENIAPARIQPSQVETQPAPARGDLATFTP